MEGTLAARLDDSGVNQSLQVVAERRGRQLHVLLDGTGRSPFGPGLDDEAKNREAYRVPQCAELLGMVLQFRGHLLILIIWK